MTKTIEDALQQISRDIYRGTTKNEDSDSIADGLFAVAENLAAIARALSLMAEGSVSPEMGRALEGLASLRDR